MEKVVIIEDEPAAVNELKILIEQEADFRLAGEAGALEDAVKLIREQQPDIVFMDINLYDCMAFDILNELAQMPRHLIFVTAYNQYAIKAIKYGALDYLLKPIDEQEFKAAIARLRGRNEAMALKEQLSLSEEALKKKHEPKHIALPALGQVRIVPLADIRYCQGDGPYTHFFLVSGKKETVSKPLKFYEALLPDYEFMRTHQSYIVHIPFVKSVLKHAAIRMDRGEEIPIAYRRRDDILAKLIR